MRTTLNLEEDAFLAAQALSRRQRIPLGAAVSRLIRAATQASPIPPPVAQLRGRYALAPARDAIVTVEHVRDLMEREGI